MSKSYCDKCPLRGTGDRCQAFDDPREPSLLCVHVCAGSKPHIEHASKHRPHVEPRRVPVEAVSVQPPGRPPDRVPRRTDARKELVVARYRESLDWLDGVPDDVNVVVYNKGDDVPRVPDRVEVIERWNAGREAETWLYHMVACYHTLAPWTYFVQGSPHGDDVIRRIAAEYRDTTPLTREYLPGSPSEATKALDDVQTVSGRTIAYGDASRFGDKKPEDNAAWLADVWASQFTSPQPSPWRYIYAAEMAVPRARMLARPLRFWKWMHGQVQRAGDAVEMAAFSPWALEATWKYLMDPKYDTVEPPKGCGCGD